MGNWDVLDAALTGVELGQEAGEWAVTAMACVALADGSADVTEIDKAREIVSKTSVIRDSLGPEFGEQLFMDTIARIQASPESELAALAAGPRLVSIGPCWSATRSNVGGGHGSSTGNASPRDARNERTVSCLMSN